MAMASAPPLPPSPMTAVTIGVRRRAISSKLVAIASAWPRSSDGRVGSAPGVSTRVMTGRRNFSACFIRRNALRYPSGRGIPNRRWAFSLASRPFWWPISMTGRPSSRAGVSANAFSSAMRSSVLATSAPMPGGGRLARVEREQAGQGRAEVAAVDDLVDHAVLELKLGALGAGRQLLLGDLLDDARPGEADESAGLGQHDVAEAGEAGGDPAGRRVGEQAEERHAGLA